MTTSLSGSTRLASPAIEEPPEGHRRWRLDSPPVKSKSNLSSRVRFHSVTH